MGQTQDLPVWAYAIPLAVLALAIVRNSRTRHLKVERLWIAPAVILAITLLAFSQQALPRGLLIAADVAALAAGAVLGWWRGRFTRISVDPQTHDLTSRTSPAGMLLILGIFALRAGLKIYATANARTLHVSIEGLTDVFLLLAVGLVCVQRLEIALRATRLLNEARSGQG